MLARGETSSRAIVEACLARIDAHDAHLHAFIEVYRDDATQSRRRGRSRRAGPEPRAARSPGLPIALKDLLHVEGRQTTAGSKSWRGRISDHTATAVAAPHGRRNDSARQDAHGRIRVRRLGPQPADGRAMESVGCEDAPRRGRLVERLRRRGRRRALSGGDRLGHGRIDPHSRGALRHHGLEAHLRPRQPLRRRAAVRHARLDRTARAHRRRLRAADRGDVRSRSARPRDAHGASRRSRGRRWPACPTCAACASPPSRRKRFPRSRFPTWFARIARRSPRSASSARSWRKRRFRSTSTT